MFQRKDDPTKQFIVTDGITPLPGDLPLQKYIYSSSEISAAHDHRSICDRGVEALRTTFGAEITG